MASGCRWPADDRQTAAPPRGPSESVGLAKHYLTSMSYPRKADVHVIWASWQGAVAGPSASCGAVPRGGRSAAAAFSAVLAPPGAGAEADRFIQVASRSATCRVGWPPREPERLPGGRTRMLTIP